MTLGEIKNKIIKKYQVGQVVNMRVRNVTTGAIMQRFKAQIIKFYPYHVSCLVNGYIESFTYWDMNVLTMLKG